MSEFEFSTLVLFVGLLLLLCGYSYWQIHSIKRRQRARMDEASSSRTTHLAARDASSNRIDDWHGWSSAPEPEAHVWQQPNLADVASPSDGYEQAAPTEHKPIAASLEAAPLSLDEPQPVSDAVNDNPPDVQFFSQQDESEHAALNVFEPIVRFFTWVEAAKPAPIDSIDGVVNITLSQPKNKADIERVLYDLHLDTRLPQRLYGRRAGQETISWQFLEEGALYAGVQLRLQLANASDYARSDLIAAWFEQVQKFTKRLSATVHAWPDSAALASYAIYLHDLAQHLSVPVVVQLHKSSGLWPAYEVHQYMTQWGAALTPQGQYNARADDGVVLYSVLNDINNPHAQDFIKEMLPTMHINTLSFCLDLARIAPQYQPSIRMWHDMSQLGQSLTDAQWCNQNGIPLDVPALMAHADVQINAYYQQLAQLNIPAGSIMLKRLSYR